MSVAATTIAAASSTPQATNSAMARERSGFPADSFYYGGFLPVKSGGRERDLLAAAAREETSVFFESPHRLLKTLEVCAQKFPERPLCVARELTKQFEEFRIGTGPVLLAHYSAKAVKGEIVFLVSGVE